MILSLGGNDGTDDECCGGCNNPNIVGRMVSQVRFMGLVMILICVDDVVVLDDNK